MMKQWFSAHSRAVLRGVLITFGMVLAGLCLLAACAYSSILNPPPVSHHAALVDLDNDGDLDAVLANGVNEGRTENTLWINQGGAQHGRVGVFTASEQRLGSAEYRDLATGDLDSDGDLDILFGNTWGVLDMFVNQGSAQGGETGQFKSGQQLQGGEYWGGLHPIGLGDLDGDGDLDILSGSCCGGLMMHENAEPERLPAYVRLWSNQTVGKEVAQFTGSPLFDDLPAPVDTRDGTEALALGDLDGDGDLDAFMAKTNETHDPGNVYVRRTAYRVWWNSGAGAYKPGEMALDCPNVNGLALGDLDGDGDLDALAATRAGGQVIINQGGAQGGAAGQFAIHPQMVGKLPSLAVFQGDLDGDGDLDALLVGWSEAQAWLNDGRGAFHRGKGSLRYDGLSTAALGDVDSDGDLDVFAARQAKNYRVWLNDGKGQLSPQRP